MIKTKLKKIIKIIPFTYFFILDFYLQNMSNTDSDNESEELSTHDELPYSHRPEWSNVVPIEQDDGPNAVVKIAYSDRFRETFDYIRACMQTNEMSERALELTTSACKLNPANYTVWCYRRQLLDHLKSDLNEELAFVGQMIKDNPKNYQVKFLFLNLI
jgi:protein farnesyltransferase/geranylgeranyltransferase type-1 subunit alpha